LNSISSSNKKQKKKPRRRKSHFSMALSILSPSISHHSINNISNSLFTGRRRIH